MERKKNKLGLEGAYNLLCPLKLLYKSIRLILTKAFKAVYLNGLNFNQPKEALDFELLKKI